MGWFDIFKKQPEQAKTEMLGLDGLSKLIEDEREKLLGEIYPTANSVARKIASGFGELNVSISAFEKKDIEKGIAFEKIAREMKTNFLARATAVAESVKFGSEMDYEGLRKFHLLVIGSLRAIAKISSDNRYLFSFFMEELKGMGQVIKRIGEAADELGRLLDSKNHVTAEFEILRSGIAEIKTLIAKEKELAALTADKMGKLALLKSERGAPESGDEGLVVHNKALEIEKRLSGLQAEISNNIGVLGRALRKFGRICSNKKLRALADELAENAELVLDESKAGELKELMEKLREVIEKGEVKLKNKSRVLEGIKWFFGQRPGELAQEYKSLSASLAECRLASEYVERKKADMRRKEEEIKKMDAEIGNLGAEIKKLGDGIEDAKKKVSGKCREILKRDIDIRI